MPHGDAARTTSATARSAVPAVPAAAPPAPAAPAAPPARPGGDPPAGPPDARAAARASLAAGRSPSLWWVCSGLVVTLLLTCLVDPSAGGAVLAGLLAASAVARAVLRPGPVALTVRSRTIDCVVLAALAAGIGLLSQVVPTG